MISTSNIESRTASRVDKFVQVDGDGDGVAWRMDANLVGDLLPAVGRQIERPENSGIETIKTGPHRTVYRMSLACGEFYLKHFRIADAKALLQNLVRPSKAEIEWQAAHRIAQLGLPTYEPVAVGRLSRSGIVHDSFLISREIPQSLPLDQFVAVELSNGNRVQPNRAAVRRHRELRTNLTICLAELAAQIHRAAVEHADFHAANVLVQSSPDKTLTLWLIDLHKVRFRSRLTVAQRFENLALLHQFFAGKLTRADRMRFYRAYRQEWRRRVPNSRDGEAPSTQFNDRPAERREIAALEDVLSQAALRGWVRADRAWKRGNRHVRKLNDKSIECRGLATLEVAWLKTVRDNPEWLFHENLVRWHKQTAKHRVAEIGLPAAAKASATGAFVKCIEPAGRWRRWLAQFRQSPVRRCWELGHALVRRGIDTPRPILFVERLDSASPKFYLLTEAVADSLSVPAFFSNRWPGLTAVERRDWLVCHLIRMACQMRRLHDAGFDHRDLKFSNLLVAHDLADPRIWLLDLDGVRVWRRLPARRAAQNIARIHVSADLLKLLSQTDGLRFLKCYLGRQFAGEWKWWWRHIAKLSQNKILGNRRRNRTLS